MTKFGAWCDRNLVTPTMENADRFAEEQVREALKSRDMPVQVGARAALESTKD